METIAKCGCNCSTCPTYKENIKTIEQRKQCSSGWKKYLDISFTPEKLKACDGCSIPDAKRNIYYLNCKIRKCAIHNQLDNCAYCAAFPCEELKTVHSIQEVNNREDFMAKTGKEITENDYQLYIEPYAGLNHLNKIRQNLSPNDYIDYKKHKMKTRFVPFDKDNDIHEGITILHTLFTSIYIEHDISYARLQTLTKKREEVLKILWTIGFYGTFDKNKQYLEIDAKTYALEKTPCMYNTVLDYFEYFIKSAIYFEIIPTIEKGWLTPTGALRKEGWLMRLKFGKALKGSETLKLFKEYLIRLDKKFGNKAFRYFKMLDLGVMKE